MCLAKLCHVRQRMSRRCLSECFEFARIRKTFWEDDIRASFAVQIRATNGPFHSFNRSCVSASDDHEVGRESMLDHCGNFVSHRLCRDDFFSIKMTASFGENLIFDMQCGSASAFVFDNCTDGAFDLAKSRICVGDHGKSTCVGYFSNGPSDF